MTRFSATPLALVGLVIALSSGTGAQARGLVAGGAISGLTHPLLGLNHLFMLLAVGTAASYISAQLLLWALGIAIHALLHGLEAPKDSSTLVCGGTCLVLPKLPTSWSKAAAVAFGVIGCWLAVGPLGLLAGGAAS